MVVKTLKSESEYEKILNWVDNQLYMDPDLDTPQGQKLQDALLIIKAYEDINYPIPLPNI
jgi:HTH-type transcriptional regulator / antitoxin HigA